MRPTRHTVDLSRVVYLGDVDDSMQGARQELTRLVLAKPDEPVTLVITSFGGSVAGMHALMDRIVGLRAAGATINGLVEGYAMSAGLILLQVCEHRMMGPHAKLMAHGITTFLRSGLDIAGLAKRQTEMIKDTRAVADLFARRTHKPVSYWMRLFRSNEPRFYRADEALAVGLVDEILTQG